MATTPTVGGEKAQTGATVATAATEDNKHDQDQSQDNLDMATVVGDRKSKRAKKLTEKGNDAYYKNNNNNTRSESDDSSIIEVETLPKKNVTTPAQKMTGKPTSWEKAQETSSWENLYKTEQEEQPDGLSIRYITEMRVLVISYSSVHFLT